MIVCTRIVKSSLYLFVCIAIKILLENEKHFNAYTTRLIMSLINAAINLQSRMVTVGICNLIVFWVIVLREEACGKYLEVRFRIDCNLSTKIISFGHARKIIAIVLRNASINSHIYNCNCRFVLYFVLNM